MKRRTKKNKERTKKNKEEQKKNKKNKTKEERKEVRRKKKKGANLGNFQISLPAGNKKGRLTLIIELVDIHPREGQKVPDNLDMILLTGKIKGAGGIPRAKVDIHPRILRQRLHARHVALPAGQVEGA
jgi:hypothetical protein